MTTLFTFTITTHSYNGNVVSIEEATKLLNNPKLSEEEITEVRDGFRFLAEVIFDKWAEDRKQNKHNNQI